MPHTHKKKTFVIKDLIIFRFQKFLREESLLKKLLSGCAGNGLYRFGVGHVAGCGFGWGVRDMNGVVDWGGGGGYRYGIFLRK